MKQFISYDEIIGVSNDFQVVEKEFSAGKAVAGGILFGGLGALAGGAMGGKKVNKYLKIKYHFNSGEKELVLTSPVAEKLKKIIDKKIGQTDIQPKTTSNLLKYHKKFYGGVFNAARRLSSKKRKD